MNGVTKSASKYPLFFTISIIVILVSSVFPFVNADFGNEDDYLGQVVDDYENADNIAAMIDTANNQTLDCMELNYSGVSPIIEDFTEYTEVDIVANRITFPNDTCVRHVSYRDEITYLYKDYGVDYFYEYDINFEVYVDTEQQYARGIPFMVSNNIGNQASHFANGWNHSVLWFYRSTSTGADRYVALTWWRGGAPPLSETDFINAYPLDTWLYVRMCQNATHLAAWIYTDEARTVLFAYLETTTVPIYYRYIYSASGYNTATPHNYIDYYVKDMTFREGSGYKDSGVYYTVNVLDGDPALAIQYNATIPADANMTMEFSTDNVTWVDHNNQAGCDILTAGYETLDLRDIYNGTTYRRVNMTLGVDTPRMWQEVLITVTDQPSEGGAAARPEGWVLTVMIAAIAGTLIILGTKRRR